MEECNLKWGGGCNSPNEVQSVEARKGIYLFLLNNYLFFHRKVGEPGPPLPKSRVGTRPLAPFVPPSMEYHLQSAISYHLLFLRKITSTWIKHASKIITNAIRDKLSFLIVQYIFSKSIDTCMQSLMRFWCLFVSERRQCFDVTKLNSTHSSVRAQKMITTELWGTTGLFGIFLETNIKISWDLVWCPIAFML